MDTLNPGRVIALDLATSCGWACGSLREGVVGSGALSLPKTEDDVGRFLGAFRKWLGEAIEQLHPGEIIFESPILIGLTNLNTLRKLYGLAGMTELVARDYDVPCFEENLTNIRMHFLGVPRAPKEIKGKSERRAWLKRRTVLECRSRGFRVATDDEADALALLSLRLSHYQPGYEMRAAAKVLAA